MKYRGWVLAAVFAFVAFVGAPSFADVPAVLSYQGVLTDGAGVAVADGGYDVTFRLYAVASGPDAPLWTETQTVTVTKGIFNVLLGNLVLLDPDLFIQPLYLGISVEGGSELPRQILSSSPYALNAGEVRGLDGQNVFPSSGNVGIGTVNPEYPLHVFGQSGQVNLSVNGANQWYSSIYVNALSPGATAGYGYERETVLRAYTGLSADDSWFLQVDYGKAIAVSSLGNVKLGFGAPTNEALTVGGGINLGTTALSNAGTMRWSGSDFEGYDGSSWKSFTATGGGGLPAGSAGQTLRHDGANWIAAGNLYNDGARIGIGTTTPYAMVEIRRDADEAVGLSLVNMHTGPNSSHRIGFDDENGAVSGLAMYDDDHAEFPSQMRLFNNRAYGSIHLKTLLGETVLTENGRLGIGVAVPDATLDVKGGNWDLAATEGDLRIGDDTNRLRIGVATDGAGAGISRIYSNGAQGRIILGANSIEALTVAPTGVDLGSASQSGALNLFRGGVADPVIRAYSTAYGGEVSIKDENADETVLITGNPGGLGGYLSVYSDVGDEGIILDGSGLGLGEPRLMVMGSTQTVAFDMASGGNGSVVFPTGAISSTEMQNEPGLVTYTEGVTGVYLTSTISSVGSQTISPPSPGYVLVLASAQFEIQHTSGTNSDATVGVSNSSTTLPSNQDIRVLLNSGLSTGLYAVPVTAHAVFYVPGGSAVTFYFLGREDMGDVRVYDIQLSCIFIPTTYGTFDAAASVAGASTDGGAPARSEIDVAAQRAASIEADNARIRGELDAMRAELEEVKTRLGSR